MSLQPQLTNREFKLLLQPDGLDRLERVHALSGIVHQVADAAGIELNVPDNASPGLRNVFFLDTADQRLRRDRLILRVREPRHALWLDEVCEVTLKCRAPTLQQSRTFDPAPRGDVRYRARLKEEILHGDAPSLYSNNAILDAVPLELLRAPHFAALRELFPALPLDAPLHIVGGAHGTILEGLLPFGTLDFGGHVSAHCDFAVWLRSDGTALVGELAFAYRIHATNREHAAAHTRADAFHRALQRALASWLHTGATKTALIYDHA